jgi:hypothetical protein|tara:strand:+ start:276 stop:506 length:231 start_codon:yes stop_codon:yes gene_type:complete
LEFNRESSGLGKLALLIDLRNPLAVPNIAKMPFLATVCEEPWPENGYAFAFLAKRLQSDQTSFMKGGSIHVGTPIH